MKALNFTLIHSYASRLILLDFCAALHASLWGSAWESLEVFLGFVYFLFWRSSICISCSMPIISSSPPGGCGFKAFEKELKNNIEHKKLGEKNSFRYNRKFIANLLRFSQLVCLVVCLVFGCTCSPLFEFKWKYGHRSGSLDKTLFDTWLFGS